MTSRYQLKAVEAVDEAIYFYYKNPHQHFQ